MFPSMRRQNSPLPPSSAVKSQPISTSQPRSQGLLGAESKMAATPGEDPGTG